MNQAAIQEAIDHLIGVFGPHSVPVLTEFIQAIREGKGEKWFRDFKNPLGPMKDEAAARDIFKSLRICDRSAHMPPARTTLNGTPQFSLN